MVERISTERSLAKKDLTGKGMHNHEAILNQNHTHLGWGAGVDGTGVFVEACSETRVAVRAEVSPWRARACASRRVGRCGWREVGARGVAWAGVGCACIELHTRVETAVSSETCACG